MIYAIVAEPEVGQIYNGKVVKIVDFGAFVNFFGKRDGLVHVSQIENRRLNHPSDVLKEGQEVKVKLLGFDDRGKVRLSMKVVDQETGEEIVPEKKEKKENVSSFEEISILIKKREENEEVPEKKKRKKNTIIFTVKSIKYPCNL